MRPPLSSEPGSNARGELLDTLPGMRRDGAQPVFAEPWQAQAFALAVRLSERGHFSWPEWAGVLAAELAAELAADLQAATGRGDQDPEAGYYRCWLSALERLVVAKGLSDPAELESRRRAWAHAYRHTPHGQPVELAGTRDDPGHRP